MVTTYDNTLHHTYGSINEDVPGNLFEDRGRSNMVKKVVMMATVPLSLLLLVSSRLTPVDNLPLSFVSSEATLFNVTLPPYLPHPNITLLPQNALECSDFDDDELYPIDPYNGFDSWDNCEIQDALSW
eukprot:CAMPEP_0197292010 /NCGR_PEP_ID=MMETSP0890-20130614/20816_1 /TAXON_ID=44058 ORGANISM="Aureoumbra lagunensis, Strain CCMP1510" /NCGR_SAMPLE_ID=MMETSP0890 /ASSEMBLY_ACC=CAM_ASM_000533 /LENGTH=127 /DNA_ID=CAMNT_0042765575 /DNA_START=97 /DNA_END=477 /DNA_ORIENTATION=-